MDKRRTQRILGILVIIALVIILFPLLFSKNEVPTQTATIATPAFPNTQKAPATAVINNQAPAASDPSNEASAVSLSSNDVIPASSGENASAPSEPNINPDSAMNKNDAPQNPASTVAQEPSQAAVIHDSAPATAEENTEVTAPIQAPNEEVQKPAPKVSSNEEDQNPSRTFSSNEEETTASQPIMEKPIQKSKPVKTSKIKKAKATQELAKLNKPAWVLQMGSFKNKENARGLTDKLRASGYHAFTKDIKSAKGNIQTRVYVGPEFKEAEATKVSQKIQRDLNLPSIVLPYKPLAL